MKFMKWLTLAALTTVLGTAVTAAPPDSSKVLEIKSALSASAVKPGQKAKLAVVLRVNKGWHINSNKPNEDFLIPTIVALKPASGITLGKPAYPKAKELKVAFSPDSLAVFEGEVPVVMEIAVAKNVKPGTVTLKGEVKYQPCDDTSCFSPATKPFTVTIKIAKPNEKISPSKANFFRDAGETTTPVAGGSAGSTNGGDRLAGILESRGLVWFLVFIFLTGLALNLTPCVYPMIAVTMSIFGARAGETRAVLLGKAIVYVLGMATMYTTLGVTAALTGGLFGSALQSPVVQIGIAVFLLILALGMFGVYTMQPPPAVANALGNVNRGGYIGLFLSGLVVGVFAAPCVGPVVIGLLALVGTRNDVALGSLSFFTLALGLGAPYLVLATFSGLLTKMPKSGGWMEIVKHLFGVVLVAVAAVYAAMVISPSNVGYVAPLALIIGAVYLGFIDKHSRAVAGFKPWRIIGGIAFIALGVFMLAQERSAQSELKALRWPVYSDAAFQAALAEGKPIVLDFTASWCAQCHELEAKTFSQREVREALKPFTLFRVELDGANRDQADELQRKWKVAGLPAVIFLNLTGDEVTEARVSGFIPPEKFIRLSELALDS
jgi:thiol:disulfide interchange protein DsbD